MMAENKCEKQVFRPVLWSLSIQMLVLVLLSAPLSLIDQQLMRSAATGGLIAIIPNVYFVFYALRYRGASQAILIARSSYQGLMGKLALNSAGFALAFGLGWDLHALTLFLAYGVMVLVQIVVAAKLSNRIAEL